MIQLSRQETDLLNLNLEGIEIKKDFVIIQEIKILTLRILGPLTVHGRREEIKNFSHQIVTEDMGADL
jgi:hypothetical protein